MDAKNSWKHKNSGPRGRPSLMYVLGMAPQKIGGIEKFLRYFVIALDAAGWDSVLCFDGPVAEEFRSYVAFPFVKIEALDNQGHLGLSCAKPLWRLLHKHRPQVFVYAFHGVLRCFPWLARCAGCRRIYFNDHSSRPEGQLAKPMVLPKRIVGRILTSPLTAILSVSDFTRRTGDAMRVTSAPNVVVRNGIEVPEISTGSGTEFRKLYGISNEELVVTVVCWMVREKGVDVMLRAAAQTLRRHSGLRFLFVGDGDVLPEYREIATQLGIDTAVIFTGLLANPTRMGVFDATDIYCQPSRWQEACGLAVLEAMAARRPVIASKTGGLPEHVEDGRSGILVPVGDSEAISAALDVLISDPLLRQNMGEAGFRSVMKNHRIEVVARKYAEIFSAAFSSGLVDEQMVLANTR